MGHLEELFDEYSVNRLISRGVPDPEFCYLAGSKSMPDPDMSDPDPNLDYCRQEEKNFCTTIRKAGMTVYPIL